MRAAVCQECGEPADVDAEFCLKCGAFLEWSALDAPEETRAEPTREPALGTTAGGATVMAPPGTRSAAPEVRVAPQPVVDEAPTGPVPVPRVDVEPELLRPVTAPLPAVPAGDRCPRCATSNPPERRFCTKCAADLGRTPVSAAWQTRPPRRLPWWRRLFGGGRSASEAKALRAYRRSLPVRYRVFRALGILLVAVLVAGAVWAVRGNPISWAKARWYDVKDTVQEVRVVQAELDPEDAAVREDYQPNAVFDGDPTTAWATTWAAGEQPPAGCSGAIATAEALVLGFDVVSDVRSLRVSPGLPADDPVRPTQHRPRLLEVRSSDGTCQTVRLADQADEQIVALGTPVSSDLLRIDVLEVYPAEEGGGDLVAVAELVPLGRPPS